MSGIVQGGETTLTLQQAAKPYHSKRPHRKSRTGCRNCKTRKVKCDEGRPACKACSLRRETCVYPPLPRQSPISSSTATAKTSSPTSTSSSSSSDHSHSPAAEQVPSFTDANGSGNGNGSALVIREPMYVPAGRNETEMRLLWFYTATTYKSFFTGAGGVELNDHVLKTKVVEHAFANPFLMNCVLALSSMHINHLGLTHLGVPSIKAIQYRAQAFEGYRNAVEAADPASFPALVACSLLLCGVSSQMFREDARPLYILDWIVVWRGIGLIIRLCKYETIFKSGLGMLFFRPNINLDLCAKHVPKYLVQMVASIPPDDPDSENIPLYLRTLAYIGSLYKELVDNGLTPFLDVRVVTLLTFIPKPYIELARQRRKPALVIITYYLVFAKCVKSIWWARDISDREIVYIANLLGPEWNQVMAVPLAAAQMTDELEIARLLLGDTAWEPPFGDRVEEVLWREGGKMSWVDDEGHTLGLEALYKKFS